MKKNNYINFILVLLALSVIILSGCTKDDTVIDFDEGLSSVEAECADVPVMEDAIEPENNYTDDKPVVVYVCGAVNSPGVYSLESEARIIDAVNAAGGMSADADDDYLNQALLLSDGDKIYVPTQEETANSEAGLLYDDLSHGETHAANADKNTADGRININTASKEVLMELPGIGEQRALMIIDYRDSNGCFRAIEDIKNVQGIKDGIYEKIKDSICL